MYYRNCFELVIFLSPLFSVGETISFCIDETAGGYSEVCADNEDLSVCCNTSLQHLVHGLNQKHNVSITLLSNITINGVIYVKNFTKMNIEGQHAAEISCQDDDDSGIYFEAVTDLTIRNLSIKGCHMLQNSSTSDPKDPQKKELIWCAVYIIDSTSLAFDHITIHHNKGTGMVIYDTGGEIKIMNSTFEDNRVSPDVSEYSGGGGLNIQFTNCFIWENSNNNINCSKQIENSKYLIKDSVFRNNYNFELSTTVISYFEYRHGFIQGLGRGGGLCFILLGRSRNNSVTITSCKFINNNASTWGGGLYISLRNHPSNNSLLVRHSEFRENKCIREGGGGAKFTLLTYQGNSSSNIISFENCSFTANSAKKNGGGVAIVTSRESKRDSIKGQLQNEIMFERCNWTKNEAALASAVDISPGVWDILGNGILPVPSLSNCNFNSNSITLEKSNISKGITSVVRGAGTLFISNYAVEISGSMNFTDNYGTAIYLQSGIVTLMSGSNLILAKNTAKYGAGIAFYAFSVMYLAPNTLVNFTSNRAYIKGGAIYAVSTDLHDVYSSKSCFLQVARENILDKDRNIRIVFSNNTAKSGVANSIYAATLKPCFSNCINENKSTDDLSFFECIGDVQGLGDSKSSVSTEPRTFNYSKNNHYNNQWVPGKYYKIPITAFDELKHKSEVVYDASLEMNNSIKLDAQTTPQKSEGLLHVRGNGTKETNTLILDKEYTTVVINISTIECPPGHVIDGNNTCNCDKSQFKGVWKCDIYKKVAWIITGFWIGLCKDDEQCSGPCPPGFCINNISIELSMRIADTHKYLCDNNRTGKLCGQCKENNSVYYHSKILKCGDEKLCSYGILFYLLSEILPLTILFVVIIMCNISFTSGAVNGFILYAQILDSLMINSYNGAFDDHLGFSIITKLHHLIYTTFNLNFFSLDSLSFCLWKGATTLDIIAFKYVTITYALLLILATVFLLNTTTCKKLCICWRPHSLKNAVVHGFTAFLVMCYSQCARVSFELLTTVDLSKHNLKTAEQVIFFSGEDAIFDSNHLKYGITAISFILFIVAAPPLLLLLYPMCFKVLALCKLSELKIVNCIANIIPIQLFDSFQSCYKDNYRFFSGLYFLYRIVPLLLQAVYTDMIYFYTIIEVFFILALSINGILQPYKKNCHNIIDSLIFTNLAIINAISLYNHQKITDGKDDSKKTLITTTIIQLILIYLPLIIILANAIRLVVKWSRLKIKKRKLAKLDYNEHALLDSTYLPPLRESRRSIADSTETSTEYIQMKT